jgi:hypothetical protein
MSGYVTARERAACPKCGALVGLPCYKTPGNTSHEERHAAPTWDDDWVAEERRAKREVDR